MSNDVVQDDLEKKAISRSVFKVFLGGIFSLLVGFVNQIIIAALFGAGDEMDAYLTALVVPAYLQSVLLTGLSFVFIPAFVREETRGNEDTAWGLVGTFFWLTTGILLIVAFVGSLFAENIISVTAPGFSPEKSMLAAKMLSILMLSVPFAGLSIFTKGIQNARNSFFWPAFGGAINSIGSILTVVLFTRYIGAMALAWGFFVAIILQSCITIFPVLRHGWPKLIHLTDNRVVEMVKMILPFILLGLLTRSTDIFERNFASILPSGQLSYLGYARKISSVYVQMLAGGIAAAIFPAMARKYTQEGKEGLQESMVYGFRLSLATAFPVILITGALSIPIVRILFERGEFDSTDTLKVAQILLIVLASGLLCRMVTNIIERTFYVLKDTITPPVISAISVLAYIGLGRYFAQQWGYIGLAFAILLQHLLNILLQCIALLFKLKTINIVGFTKNVVTYILAALGAFFVGKTFLSVFVFLPELINLFVSGLASSSFYLTFLYFSDHEIYISILEMTGVRRLLSFGRRIKFHISHIDGLP